MKGLAVQSVAVERVQASPHNPRKRFEEGSLRELAESIRMHGVLQPLVVRPLGEGWEVVAGERRWRAAKLAGIGEVPVVVRELNDVQAAEVQILENLQREDIAPMEEAAGFKRLIDLGAYTPDTLAERLGKSRSHVYGRLRLLKVTPEVQEAVRKGLIEASVVELLAKFPAEVQPEVLAAVKPPWRGAQTRSFRECKEVVADFWPALKGAPWVRTDPADLVPGAGTCAGCPKWSANMPDMEGFGGKDGVCTDSRCFRAKSEAVRAARLQALQAEGRAVLPLEEVGKAFGLRGTEPGHGTGLVAVGSRCFEADEVDGATWGELVKGQGVEVLAAVLPNGRTVEVMREAEARDAAVKAGRIKARSAGRGAGKVERSKVIAENRRRRAVLEAWGEACVARVGELEEASFLRQLLERCVYKAQAEAGRQGLDWKALGVADLRRLAVRALAWSASQGWSEFELEPWGALVGETRKAAEARAAGSPKARAKAKAGGKARKGGRRGSK